MMTGWKTWAAGIALILAGVGRMLTYFEMVGGDLDVATVQAAITHGLEMVGAGLAVIGVGHKVEKLQQPKPPPEE